MKILLLAMPDTADVFDYYTLMPNLAIVSLAGSLQEHEVKVLDLVVCKPKIRQALEKVLRDFKPDLIGLSAMTFQFDTLVRVAKYLRLTHPTVKLAAGGYHATLMAEEITTSGDDLPLDFLIRGEGEATLRELVAELAKPVPNFQQVAGLSYRQGDVWFHNPLRPLLDLSQLPLPNRGTRLRSNFYFLDKTIDVVETSRGCPYNCKFCSITHMYGHTFRPFPIDRIITDLKAVRRHGGQAVFLVDDNITFDINHFHRVCQAIVDHGLNDLYYTTQVTAVGIAQNPDLVAAMARANFHTVFVGFESMDPTHLKKMKKPTNPEINQRAAALLRQHGIAIIAGLIVGYPEDTRESVINNFRLLLKLKPDLIYPQFMTPYPKTIVRQELLEAGLVVNINDFRTYDGFSCNIRTHHLDQKNLYRILKTESVKCFLTPSQISANRYLRQQTIPFLRAAAKAFLTNIYNVLRTRRLSRQLDI